MDRRTTLALALCLLVFALFTALQARYTPKPKPGPPAGPSTGGSTTAAPPGGAPPESSGRAAAPAPGSTPGGGASAPATSSEVERAAPPRGWVAPSEPARTIVMETPLYRATFSSIGARLQSIELKRYAAAWGESRYAEHPGRRPKRGREVPPGDRVLLRGEPAFAFDMGSGTSIHSLAEIPFTVARESTDASGAVVAVTFTARDSSGLELRQSWHARPDAYLLDYDVSVSGAQATAQDWWLTTRSWPLLSEASPDQDARLVRSIGLLGKNLHRDAAQGLEGRSERWREGAALWAGVQSHYFLGLVAPVGTPGRATISRGSPYSFTPLELSRLPQGAKPVHPIAEGVLVMGAPPAGRQSFAVYFGPADYFLVKHVSVTGPEGDLQLDKAVDMGATWLQFLSRPLLSLMRLLESVVGNYGVAIFLLATLVRLVLHPFNMSSMRSMRAMQRLQPELERIREKFKGKPEAMNTAVMALYRENKVNPAGGCLPMLAQMPLFFALYAVLSSAIELRQAPFVGWIHDLSAPDHLFSVAGFSVHLLPIIMTATGFLQQRLTPTPGQQQSTIYLMNLFMLFVFYGLPSGLVFYWTVMNLYTSLQQWLAIRGDVGVVVPAGTGSARARS